MKDKELLAKLEEALGQLDIEVRWVQADLAGGICYLDGKKIFYINPTLTAWQRIELLCRELSHVDLSGLFLLPAVRARVGKSYQNRKHGA